MTKPAAKPRGAAIATSRSDAIHVRERNLVEELLGKIDFTSR